MPSDTSGVSVPLPWTQVIHAHTQKKTLMEESSEGRKKSEWGLKSGVFQRLTSSTAARSNINCGKADKSSSLFSRAFPLLLRDR